MGVVQVFGAKVLTRVADNIGHLANRTELRARLELESPTMRDTHATALNYDRGSQCGTPMQLR